MVVSFFKFNVKKLKIRTGYFELVPSGYSFLVIVKHLI